MTENDQFYKRMRVGAKDFWLGVKPLIESQLNAKIMPLEQLQENETIKAFDQAGIDAFYLDQEKVLRGLGSRMNYNKKVADEPMFTLRYAKWDYKSNDWDYNCEYQRKLGAAKNPESFSFFPAIHVESFGLEKSKGLIGWSYLAKTADIVGYIEVNLGNIKKVRTFTPSIGEKRQVVVVPIQAFASEHEVTRLKLFHN